jgi:23S rRNA (cytosine1962-C5)-methyltransferase
MSNYPQIILSPGKEQSLLRFHPWVFSGAIKKVNGEPQEGDVVEVYSSRNEFLGMGHAQQGSIAVRLFSFEQTALNVDFWKKKIKTAYDYRTKLGLTNAANTNVYRLVYAEGDGMPGLIIDYYNGTAVMQAHSVGMFLHREDIVAALKDVLGDKLKAVYDKSEETLPKPAELDAKNGYLFGNTGLTEVVENGNKFLIDWEHGQKTGFFVDQRENRELLARYSKGKTVANTFCYTGGFSVYALNAGAKEVHSVDSSKKAIELTDKNIQLNNASANHTSFAIDTFDFLEGKENAYDIIILDPPAFAKHRDAKHNAVKGYKRLNAEALKKIKPGGILFTFSCSQVVDRYLFNSTVLAAAITVGRNVRIMHQLSQPPDHPINIYNPEGEYLKGLVVYVE